MTPTEPVATPEAGRRRLLDVVRRGYAALLVVVLGSAVVLAREELVTLVRDAQPALLLAALVASFGMLGLSSALWHSSLRSLGAEPAPAAVLSATARSLPARYLPGSVWYAVSRGALLRAGGVPTRALAATAAVEMVLAPVVGFALGGALLAVSGRAGGVLTAPLLAAVAALAVSATPPVLNRVLHLVWRRRPGAPPRLDWPAVGRLVAWLAAFWLWSGSVFALYLAAFPSLLPGDPSPLVTLGSYMVAWGVGWLAVFAPQGLGVFEVTLAAALGTGSAGAAVLLGGYRVVVLARDLLAAGAASWLHRRAAGPRVHSH